MGLDAHVQSEQDAFQNLLAGLTSEQAWDVIYVMGATKNTRRLHGGHSCEACLGGHCFDDIMECTDASRLGEAQTTAGMAGQHVLEGEDF